MRRHRTVTSIQTREVELSARGAPALGAKVMSHYDPLDSALGQWDISDHVRCISVH
jgi:hypothetical protein